MHTRYHPLTHHQPPTTHHGCAQAARSSGTPLCVSSTCLRASTSVSITTTVSQVSTGGGRTTGLDSTQPPTVSHTPPRPSFLPSPLLLLFSSSTHAQTTRASFRRPPAEDQGNAKWHETKLVDDAFKSQGEMRDKSKWDLADLQVGQSFTTYSPGGFWQWLLDIVNFHH